MLANKNYKKILLNAVLISFINNGLAQSTNNASISEEIKLAQIINEKLSKYKSVSGIKFATSTPINTNEMVVRHTIEVVKKPNLVGKVEDNKNILKNTLIENQVKANITSPIIHNEVVGNAATLRKILPNGDIEEVITINNIKRKYVVHMPNKKGRLYSGIVVLIGGDNKISMEQLTNFNKSADTYNLVTVYPETNTTFSLDNDNLFFKTLFEKTTNEYKTKKLYVAGYSTGGITALELSCSLKEIKAIATVAALYPEALKKDCKTIVPMLLIIGTSDPIMPYSGGKIQNIIFNSKMNKDILSSEETMDFIANKKVYGNPKIEKFYKGEIDYTRVTKNTYVKENKPMIIMYEIQGAGHTWPSGVQYAPRNEIGKTSAQINASDVIAKFFTTLE